MEEIRVSGWSELHERLFADSWNDGLGLHRSNFAYRGRRDADDDLGTSLLKLGGDTRTLGNLLRAEVLESVAPELGDLERLGDDFVVLVEPPSFDERIVNQYARFSLASSPDRSFDEWLLEHEDLARRLVMPAAQEWEVRDKLDQANVTERVLFPGLDGLRRWLVRYHAPRGRPDPV